MKGKGVKVKKRDGSVEDFDDGKIKRIALATGLNESEADELAKDVEKWAKDRKQPEVTSIDIRDKVSSLLKKVDDYAYKKYIWWQGYKSKHFSK